MTAPFLPLPTGVSPQEVTDGLKHHGRTRVARKPAKSATLPQDRHGRGRKGTVNRRQGRRRPANRPPEIAKGFYGRATIPQEARRQARLTPRTMPAVRTGAASLRSPLLRRGVRPLAVGSHCRKPFTHRCLPFRLPRRFLSPAVQHVGPKSRASLRCSSLPRYSTLSALDTFERLSKTHTQHTHF